MTHSKGTWDFDAESGDVTTDDRRGDWCVNDKRTLICHVNSLDGVSNGPLLAAALDMLNALKTALRHSRDAMSCEDRYAFDNRLSGPEWMFIARSVIDRVERRS